MGRPGGMDYIPQTSLSLNTTSMMAIRQQMDESNMELVNTLTQQMRTIFIQYITNTNQTYEFLRTKWGE